MASSLVHASTSRFVFWLKLGYSDESWSYLCTTSRIWATMTILITEKCHETILSSLNQLWKVTLKLKLENVNKEEIMATFCVSTRVGQISKKILFWVIVHTFRFSMLRTFLSSIRRARFRGSTPSFEGRGSTFVEAEGILQQQQTALDFTWFRK